MNCLVCQAEVPAESTLYDCLQHCPGCGFVFASRLPSDEEIRRLYQAAYFAGEEYADYVQDKAILQRNFRRLIRVLERFSTGGRLYEVGAAYGFFLELARERWQVEGIDVSEEACTYARQQLDLNVQCGEFLAVPLPESSYDVVCMWDTIEHLREPSRYVEKAACCLRPGGYLALTTGDIGSWSARVQGRYWRLIHPPTHLYYFSSLTIKRLLDRFGFEIVHLSYPGFYRSVGAMVRWLLVRIGDRGFFYHKLKDRWWARVGVCLNMYDIMFVIARKNSKVPVAVDPEP